MKQHLIDQVFKIQKEINKVLPDPDDCDWTDSGMFVDPKNSSKINVMWRDTSYGIDGKEFHFSWSTSGEFNGELPSEIQKQVLAILEPLKNSAPFIPITNIDDVK